MSAITITVAQQKGGAGKTTLVAQLAALWLSQGKSVATVDIDPQKSLSGWVAARRTALGENAPPSHVTVTGWRTQKEVESLAAEHDIVLIDSPPHADTEAKIAVRAADLVLAPVQLSPMDVWATGSTLALAQSEKRPLLVVLNRVPARAKLADGLIAEVKKLGAGTAKARLGNRVAFAASMLQGLGVVELPRNEKAKAELAALGREVLRRAAKG